MVPPSRLSLRVASLRTEQTGPVKERFRTSRRKKNRDSNCNRRIPIAMNLCAEAGVVAGRPAFQVARVIIGFCPCPDACLPPYPRHRWPHWVTLHQRRNAAGGLGGIDGALTADTSISLTTNAIVVSECRSVISVQRLI